MPAPAWEDLGVFFDLGEFAIAVRLEPAGGPPRTVSAIFDEPDATAELGRYDAELTGPTVTAPLDALRGMSRGDRVVIGADTVIHRGQTVVRDGELVVLGGETLDVLRGPRPDGTGLAVLPLARP